MASAETKCPVCGKAVGVGLVSGLLLQHDNKYGERCEGSGGQAVVQAPRSTGSSRTASPRTASTRREPGSASASSPRKGSVSVRRVDVDPERVRRLEERQQALRDERARAARARNEFYSSGVDIREDDPDA